jgi:hypothetical protein
MKLQDQARSLLGQSEKLSKQAELEDDKVKKLELLLRAKADAEQAESLSKTAQDLAAG